MIEKKLILNDGILSNLLTLISSTKLYFNFFFKNWKYRVCKNLNASLYYFF